MFGFQEHSNGHLYAGVRDHAHACRSCLEADLGFCSLQRPCKHSLLAGTIFHYEHATLHW